MRRALSASRDWRARRRLAGRIAALLLLALELANCGKNGPPQPPPGVPNVYPRPYPRE
jgi:hypothetical protein